VYEFSTTVMCSVQCSLVNIACVDDVEQSLSVEDKVLLAQAASERAAIVAKYDKVSAVVYYMLLCCRSRFKMM